MKQEQSEITHIDPCRTVSIISFRRIEVSEFGCVPGVRLVLRHHQSGREFPLVLFSGGDGVMQVVSDYVVLGDAKGLRTDRNNRGQLKWQRYDYPDGWVTARYMFPDEQEAYQAAVIMGADFTFLLNHADPIPH